MPDTINIPNMLQFISDVTDPLEIKLAGQAFLEKAPPERTLEIASALSFGNPFYIPNISDDNAKQMAISIQQFAELTMRARITCHHADQANILVACAPKSASTFIWGALMRATGLPGVSLAAATMSPLSSSKLGMNLREQETDELALIRNGRQQYACVPFRVYFRKLGAAEIDAYLHADKPYDCAGSFKSESLGIALFERMQGDDPTALMGLPLITLSSWLHPLQAA